MMEDIIIVKNLEDKKYRISSFRVNESEFKVHEDAILEFNEKTPFYMAFHYLARNDYDKEVMVRCLLDGMDIIGYKSSESISYPMFYTDKTVEV